jgi:hypothetical protein
MNRTITSEETEKLFAFCRQRFVYHYDLQVELVDHMASSIEEQWKENPEIPLNTALLNTFKRFGISGFSTIKEQKRKELKKNYNRLWWKYLLGFFRWPKIVMTVAFTLVFATLFKLVENDIWIIAPYFSGMTILLVYYYYKIFPKRYKILSVKGKKFMLVEQLNNTPFVITFFLQMPIQIFNFWNISRMSYMQNTLGLYSFSLGIVFLTIGIWGELFYVPEKIKEHFKEQFPEFAL